MKRLMVAAILAAVSLSIGCLECPEGTVACVISEIVIETDTENHTVNVRRSKYKTCVTPDNCDATGIDIFDPRSNISNIDQLALQLAALTGKLDRRELRVDVDSEVGQLGNLEGAEFTVRLARLGAGGEVLRQSHYSGPLELVEERADGWTFIPAADAALGDYVAAMARLAATTAADEHVVMDYDVTLKFDRAVGALDYDDIKTEIAVAGYKI